MSFSNSNDDNDSLDLEEAEVSLDIDDQSIETKELQLHESDLGEETNALLPYVQNTLKLSDKEYKNFKKRLWSFSAGLRQPRKDVGTCNKTPFFCRWDTNSITSHLTPDDPRYASQVECQKVCATLTALFLEADQVILDPTSQAVAIAEAVLARKLQPHSLICVHTANKITAGDIKLSLGYATQRLGAYEIPVSYRLDLSEGGLHHHENVGWMKPLHVNYKLRESLRNHLKAAGASSKAIKNALDKIQVKAYCTDKDIMPPHFSNRDFRWATWTDSPQYASHYQCAMIELELMSQLYEFAGAPKLVKGLFSDLGAEVEEVRGQPVISGSMRCFVTGRILNYSEYVQAAINPKGGKSKYHVGHILPLTREGKHAFDNIAWMSDDGNRIQGNDTVEEIEAKLADSVEFHLRRDMDELEPSQVFYEKSMKLWNLLNDVREKLGKPKLPW